MYLHLFKHVLYELKFSRWFYFREFYESNPRENFHFNLCLFIVMTTSTKSRITAPGQNRENNCTRK